MIVYTSDCLYKDDTHDERVNTLIACVFGNSLNLIHNNQGQIQNFEKRGSV